MGPLTYFRKMKSLIQYLVQLAGLSRWLDGVLFRAAERRNRAHNREYRRLHPEAIIPPDYFLYETYRLDYRKFVEDSKVAAAEIIEWTAPWTETATPVVLDWGCGAGRITRHITDFAAGAAVYGCDTNEQMISWNRQTGKDVTYSVVDPVPPMLYAPEYFDMVYGFSVLTHIHEGMQEPWLAELYRILKPGGVLLVTTHGRRYLGHLLPWQKGKLRREGMFTKNYPLHGRRMMATYHDPSFFRRMVVRWFEVVGYTDGSTEPGKIGGQDLWILRKRK